MEPGQVNWVLIIDNQYIDLKSPSNDLAKAYQ